MTKRRRRVLFAAGGLAVVVIPSLLLGVGRFSAFEVFGQDDPLGEMNARIDLVVCFAEGLDRFAPDNVVEEVLVVSGGDGSFNMRAGVDGFSFDSTGREPGRDVLKIDFYPNASDEQVEELETALVARPEVDTVLRSARAADCAERRTGDSTTTTR